MSATPRHLPALLTEAAARAQCERGLAAAWRRWRPGPRRPDLPKLECLWLPCHLIRFDAISPKGPGQITISVEAWSGAFSLFGMEEDLLDGPPPGEHFPPRLSADDAIASGRKDLIRAILRERTRGPKPEPRDVLHSELFYHPFWVYYFERKPGIIDIKLIDAATGSPGGGQIRTGMLNALVAHADRDNASAYGV